MNQKIALIVVLGTIAPSLAGCTARVVAEPPRPPRAEVVVVAPPPPRAEVVVAAPPPPPPPRAEVVVVAPPPPRAEVVVERPAPPVAEVVIEAPPPPPPLVVEVQPPAPSPNHFWIAGYHRWDGHQYIWTKGRYEVRPHAGARWMPARWEPRAKGKVWVEGHWG